jgi:hypothetical protein
MDYVVVVTGDKRLTRVLTFLCVLGCLTIGQWRCAADPILISLPGSWPTLTAGAVTNGQVPLTLNGEASVQYIIESSPDLLNWSPVATNADNYSIRQITLPASTDVMFYRASRKPIPLFTYALAAQGNIILAGNGLTASSWNSYEPTQSTNGTYNGYTGTNADFASVAGIVDPGNHTVDGSLFLGPTASYTGGGNFSGSIYADTYLVFPDVSLPNASWLPAPLTNGTHAFTTSGFYSITDNNSISVEPGMVVTISVTPAVSFSPPSINIKGGTTNSGTLVVYQNQGNINFLNISMTVGRPQNFIFLGLPGVTALGFSSTQNFVGLIYAPEAIVILNGGGLSSGFIGSCIVSNATVNSHYGIHYDESLRTNGPVR